MWNKIGRIVMQLSEKLEISPLRALDVFYTSTETELCTFSDAYIVDEIIMEIRNNKYV